MDDCGAGPSTKGSAPEERRTWPQDGRCWPKGRRSREERPAAEASAAEASGEGQAAAESNPGTSGEDTSGEGTSGEAGAPEDLSGLECLLEAVLTRERRPDEERPAREEVGAADGRRADEPVPMEVQRTAPSTAEPVPMQVERVVHDEMPTGGLTQRAT